MKNNILNVIGEENYRKHKEYVEKYALRYSVLRKSDNNLPELNIREIMRSGVNSDVKREALFLASEYLAHKLYFSSFAGGASRCDIIRQMKMTEAEFLYSLFLKGRDFGEGFMFIMKSKRGISTVFTRDSVEAFTDSSRSPVLALDLFEHAYYLDYGFEREQYLRRALSFINLSLLF